MSTKYRPSAHICVASGQTLPNFLPLLQDDSWRHVEILSSPPMLKQAKRLRKLVEDLSRWRGRQASVHIRDLPDEGDEAAVQRIGQRCLEELCEQWPDHRVVANITGGTKLMALDLYDIFRSRADVIYCDTDRATIRHRGGEVNRETELQPNLLSVKGLLAVQGVAITEAQWFEGAVKDDVMCREALTARLTLELPGRSPWLEGTFERSIKSQGLLAILVKAANDVAGAMNAGTHPPQFREVALKGELDAADLDLLNALSFGDVARYEVSRSDGSAGSSLRLEFNTLWAAKYLAGGFVEEFVFRTAAALDLPVEQFVCNAQIRSQYAHAQARTNELDLALVWNNQLLVIESKAARALGNNHQDVLNKIKALREAVGGLKCRSWVVQNGDLKPYQRNEVEDRKLLLGSDIEVKVGPRQLWNLESDMAAWAKLETNRRPWYADYVAPP